MNEKKTCTKCTHKPVCKLYETLLNGYTKYFENKTVFKFAEVCYFYYNSEIL